MRLGIVAFLAPFFFVLNPALLGRAPIEDVLICGTTGLIGAVFLAGGFFGYMRSRLNILQRLLYLAAGFLLLAPSNRLSVIGLGLLVESFLIRSILNRRREEAKDLPKN